MPDKIAVKKNKGQFTMSRSQEKYVILPSGNVLATFLFQLDENSIIMLNIFSIQPMLRVLFSAENPKTII